jgi:hypothetical protein
MVDALRLAEIMHSGPSRLVNDPLSPPQAVSDADGETKRNREIAENEADRQTVSDIRVSGWAIAAAVIIGLAAVGWVLIHNN